MLWQLVDEWTWWHFAAGVLVGLLRAARSWTVAGAFAWEWLEADGLGPVGTDPWWLNSLVDVLVAAAGRELANSFLRRRVPAGSP